MWSGLCNADINLWGEIAARIETEVQKTKRGMHAVARANTLLPST
jgi:hypothetical protein